MKCIKTIKSESNNLKEAFPVIYHSSGKLIYSNIYTFKVWEYNIENNIENKVTNEKIYLTFKTSKGHITKINTDTTEVITIKQKKIASIQGLFLT